MKYNSCLLDRLYSTKCNYMQIHLLCVTSYAFHAQKKREKKKMLRIQKKLYILLYENRKYQSKMCTNSLYHVTKNLQYKKTYENDQITHYLEHRGMGTGLVTGQRQNLAPSFHRWTPVRATSMQRVYIQIQRQHHTQLDRRVKQANQKLQFLIYNFGAKPSECRCPMHSIKFGLVCVLISCIATP